MPEAPRLADEAQPCFRRDFKSHRDIAAAPHRPRLIFRTGKPASHIPVDPAAAVRRGLAPPGPCVKKPKQKDKAMPRPKKEPDARRTERINPRFTPAELLRIESAASVAGMSASEYVRMQALRGRVVVQQRRELSGEVFDELRRIGVNINQIARIANATGRAPARLETALETLERILLREMGDDDAPAPPAAAPKPAGPHGP